MVLTEPVLLEIHCCSLVHNHSYFNASRKHCYWTSFDKLVLEREKIKDAVVNRTPLRTSEERYDVMLPVIASVVR